MCFSSLVVISPNSQLCPTSSALGSPHKAQCIQGSTIARWPTYTRQQLLSIQNMVKQDNRYSRIPFETINLVRKFKINKHPSKLDKECPIIKETKIQTKNIVNIEIKPNNKVVIQHVRIATINTRSIKNKVELVLENSELHNLDFLAITETWFHE